MNKLHVLTKLTYRKNCNRCYYLRSSIDYRGFAVALMASLFSLRRPRPAQFTCGPSNTCTEEGVFKYRRMTFLGVNSPLGLILSLEVGLMKSITKGIDH